MDTTATVRKESIEDQKAEIQERINHAIACRDQAPNMFQQEAWDNIIDRLIGEKEAITEQIEIVTAVEWLSENEEPMSETGDEYKQYARLAHASESDNLYELGMGR